MGADQVFLTVIYFVMSLSVFLVCRSISRHLSGDNFSDKWFWVCLVGVLFWGAAQFSVARYGSILLFSSSLEFLVNNEWVRWIAFISALLQATCIPKKSIRKN
ncbi:MULTISPECIES: hypothetical protein [unclassified Pseudomonas]|uniref:hypothetical protein n=1 Tax=unclassified Pseudomonas TaxID=196821 RepID=UPI00081BEA08|nr:MULTISPECIES: hypothetical protein [unclassified Pseudomonas]